MPRRSLKPCGAAWCISSGAPFVLGLIAALIMCWWIIPAVFFVQKEQPVAFTHASHIKNQNCADCHFLRADGSFSAIPSTEQCASCHADMQGTSAAEAGYIESYVSAKKEVPWLIRQKQPAHVFFSHAAHNADSCRQLGCHGEYVDENALCSTCHADVSALDTAPYLENRLTGYSKDTMRMQDCKSCHAEQTHLEMTDAALACNTCHK
ncbi:MAG: cytochrome c family protein [Deltaproteobacteria bacterium]|nr:cytochrome c family protein [Deltaproteobacteria bacterium]